MKDELTFRAWRVLGFKMLQVHQVQCNLQSLQRSMAMNPKRSRIQGLGSIGYRVYGLGL